MGFVNLQEKLEKVIGDNNDTRTHTTYEFYLASEYAFAFADNKKVAGYNDKNSNN